MIGTPTPGSRNLFEVDNARNMSTEEVVATFLPTQSFFRLLSNKNHIVCGARGSGKTVLMKMLGHEHLSRLPTAAARRIIEDRLYIGIYVPTKIEWVSGLKNKPWADEGDAELHFQWRLNIATCMRLLVTLRSCMRSYVPDEIERARKEIELARAISQEWSAHDFKADTLKELENYLSTVEYQMQMQLARLRVAGRLRDGEEYVGAAFFCELFVPLRRAIAISSQLLQFPSSTNWLLCLDEAEFLDELQQRIINTHLRADSGNLFFKISTMPYHHKTVATNTGADLVVGHDFDYVYIDRDLVDISPAGDDTGEEAALQILEKRAIFHRQPINRDTLMYILGPSPLLDPMPAEWHQDSRTMALIEKYGDRKLINRAHRLSGRKEFRDQIARKIKPALVLREAVEETRGHKVLDVYSGLRLAIRCSDANPRTLIRIFNLLLLRASRTKGKLTQLSPSQQTTLLSQFSESVLNRSLSQPRVGQRLFGLLSAIGRYAQDQLLRQSLSSDQFSGAKIDGEVSGEDWEAIKAAVGIGLLFPQTTPTKGDRMPEKVGAFHLAYVLAPHFTILPRRGRPSKLSVVLQFSEKPLPDAEAKNVHAAQLTFGLKDENE